MSQNPHGPKKSQPPPQKRSLLRRLLRAARLFLLLFILVLLAFALYLNQFGFPEFVQQRLRQPALARGWQLDFGRARLHSWRELAIENFHLRRTNHLAGPELFVTEAHCRFRASGWLRFHLDLDSLVINRGFLLLPVDRTNAPPIETTAPSHRRVTLEDLNGELRIRSDDQWELRNFSAAFLGANIQFSGVLTNSSLLRDWKLPKRERKPGAGQAFWSNVLRAIEPFRFSGKPQLLGQFYGDAAEPRSMDASIRFIAPGIDTPWGSGTNVQVFARLSPPTHSEDIVLMDLDVSAGDAHTRWGSAERVRLRAQIEPNYPRLASTNASLTIDANSPITPWAEAGSLQLHARLTACPTNLSLLQNELTARCINPTVAPPNNPAFLARASYVDFSATSVHPWWQELRLADTNLPWTERFRDLVSDASVTVSRAQFNDLHVDKLVCEAEWKAPTLLLKTSGHLPTGKCGIDANLNGVTGEVTFNGNTSFDPHTLTNLLPARTRRWLARYSWEAPPRLQANGHMLLPTLSGTFSTNSVHDPTNWLARVLPTISLAGQVDVGPAAYRGVPVLSATSPFAMTNFIWHMPQLVVHHAGGKLDADYSSDLRTSDFHWRLSGPVNPKAIKPLLETDKQRQFLDDLQSSTPSLERPNIPRVHIDGELWGRWRDFERFGADLQVSATNIAFRGQSVSSVRSRVLYTNQMLTFIEPRVLRPGEEGSAPGVAIDLAKRKLYLTNAFGNLDPHAVARAIGPKTARSLAPYHFESPPTTRATGMIDIKKKSFEDHVRFEVSGGKFQWAGFTLQQLAGKIDWIGRTVTLVDVRGAFNKGQVQGGARFDLSAPSGADFAFNAVMAEADLAEVLSGFIGPLKFSSPLNPNPAPAPPNHSTTPPLRSPNIEGLLSGELVVTSGNTSNRHSWQGHGHVNVRDGLLWDLPMFGLFSPVFNAFVPGLGNSRAREASSTFTISNSVIRFDPLEVHATAMRMQFQGVVDFDGKVDTRVEAELLRDFPGIGLIISKVLWPVTKIFEYKVTGTLANPKAEPVYVIPRILFLPLQPFKTLKDLVAPEQPQSDLGTP